MEQSFAGLKHVGLRGGAAYYDAQMDDARLCIEVLKSAAEKGAWARDAEVLRKHDPIIVVVGPHEVDRPTVLIDTTPIRVNGGQISVFREECPHLGEQPRQDGVVRVDDADHVGTDRSDAGVHGTDLAYVPLRMHPHLWRFLSQDRSRGVGRTVVNDDVLVVWLQLRDN